MITNNPNRKYIAFKVNWVSTEKRSKILNMVIGDSEKVGDTYKNKGFFGVSVYNCEGFEDIKDGDKYIIKSINSVSRKEVGKRTYVNLICDIAYADNDREFVRNNIAETVKKEKERENTFYNDFEDIVF